MSDNLKQKTISGLFWQFSQKFIGQIFSFVVTLILARLLLPEDYGVVAIAGMFNILAGIFINCSLDIALVQKKDVDELDYNTVFYSALLASIIVYLGVYCCAPIVSNIYKNELICPVIRTMALTMPLSSLSIIQNTKIIRSMKFKTFFYTTLIGQIFAGVFGIYFAFHGYGAWALVIQSLVGSIVNTLSLFCIVRWLPKLMYSFERFKALFSFAWKRSAAGLMGTFCNQLKGYLIGYQYTTADLAFLNRGEGLPDMLKNNISGTIDGVLFPALTKLQDDKERLKSGIKRSIIVANYVLAPTMFGLAAVSDKLVPLLYSAKWSPAIPFMQISCITVCVIVINNTNLQALYAIGRSDEVLRIEFIKKIVMIFILLISIYISPIAISAGFLVHSCHELFWTSRSLSKYVDYSLCEQLNDIKSSSLLAFSMGIVVILVGENINNIYISLFVQVLTGFIYYVIMSHIFDMKGYKYIASQIISNIRKRKH